MKSKLADELCTGTWKKWNTGHMPEYYPPKPKAKRTESGSTAVSASLPSVKEEHEDGESMTTVVSGIAEMTLADKGKAVRKES